MNTTVDKNTISEKTCVPEEIGNPECHKMGDYFNTYRLTEKLVALQPRGLVNRGNNCYINSILQALVACSPLFHVLFGLLSRNIPLNGKRKPTPIIDGMYRFVKEFRHLSKKKTESAVTLNIGTSLEPTWIFKMLSGIRNNLIEGRQEDAEEFLSLLLNGLDYEMLELMKDANRNKPQTALKKTPLRGIFGGVLKSKIYRQEENTTENVQPFVTLQLDIGRVKTVGEALEMFAAKNQLEGLTSSRTNERVVAWQQTMLEELPVVLVLHLKCYKFGYYGCTKIVKPLEYPVDLNIDPKLISSDTENNIFTEHKYNLFAVVHHEGRDSSRGHYFTDAFHVGYGSWLRYDDASVKRVTEQQVLKPQGTRMPYLLFYRRDVDAIKK